VGDVQRTGAILVALIALLVASSAASSSGSSTGVGAVAGVTAARDALPANGLVTAFYDPSTFSGPEAATAFGHAYSAGAGAVLIAVVWAAVAPAEPSTDPTDPANPAYHWDQVTTQVTLALQAGLEPILDVYGPPNWAKQPGADGLPQLRDPADVGRFMLAAARRYSGDFEGLPRVRYWQVWNEPNDSEYLDPQYLNGQPASPAIYRQMVNAAADAVHSVHADNVVIAGGQSPFGQGNASTDPRAKHVIIAPMSFMRDLLAAPIKFDVWAHHPYTAGGPNTKAKGDDVSLGNMPQMKAALDAAVAAGRIQSDNGVRFWVSEFSWDSKPPDKRGVPVTLETEWVAEALYRAWNSGVSLFTWFEIRDNPQIHFESALYFRGATVAADTPKPARAAFLFPFVGHIIKGKLIVWGRTPWGQPGTVQIEELHKGGGWTVIGTVATDANGIFTQTFGSSHGKYVRARVAGGLVSPQFPEKGTKNMKISPFGGG
jgi:Cellulase (glycosyl hydrolase family 5)